LRRKRRSGFGAWKRDSSSPLKTKGGTSKAPPVHLWSSVGNRLTGTLLHTGVYAREGISRSRRLFPGTRRSRTSQPGRTRSTGPSRNSGRPRSRWSWRIRISNTERPQNPAGLSRREVDVLCLAARGLTTRQIADKLFISAKAANHHIQHIYNEISVSTRAAAALWAMQHAAIQ